eukprot:1516781-Pyramimonas_sp.AAC.1
MSSAPSRASNLALHSAALHWPVSSQAGQPGARPNRLGIPLVMYLGLSAAPRAKSVAFGSKGAQMIWLK